ncbi:P-loop containing nucleoside triphosphate hydrolase protein [Biscogniauxia marginata]|nr:P-loop containing nucleoside triphosphate hydrolase protein [Biscogniauxia marginata]
MNEVYDSLTHRALATHNNRPASEPTRYRSPGRTLIALSGAPGSGKSTIAVEVQRRLNEKAGRPLSAIVPMDGFHYPRAYLDTLPDRDEAYARRGAHWTFDASGVLALARRLSRAGRDMSEIVFAPGFDHALKDSVENAIQISSQVEIVILEGNWLLFDAEPWNQIAGLVDDTWFVEVSPAIARDRIARRHLEAGIEDTWDTAISRAEKNDLPNGEEIRRHLITPGVIVHSIEEPLKDSP